MHEACEKRNFPRNWTWADSKQMWSISEVTYKSLKNSFFSNLLTFIFDLKIDPSHTSLVLVEFNDFYETILNYCIVHIAFHTLYVMYAILSGYYKSKVSSHLKPLTFWCILPHIAFTYISFHSHYWTSNIT